MEIRRFVICHLFGLPYCFVKVSLLHSRHAAHRRGWAGTNPSPIVTMDKPDGNDEYNTNSDDLAPMTDLGASSETPETLNGAQLQNKTGVASSDASQKNSSEDEDNDRSISENISLIERAASDAFACAENAKVQHEHDICKSQVLISALATECSLLSERVDELAKQSGTAAENARGLDAERAHWIERASVAEAERDNWAAKLRGVQAEKSSVEEALATAANAAAQDASAIAATEIKVAELSAAKIGLESRLAASAAETEELMRQSRDRDADLGLKMKRIQYLEDDRTRLLTDLEDLRSKHDVLVQNYSRDTDRAEKNNQSLQENMEWSQKRAETAERQVDILERQVSELQSDREKLRVDSLREIENLQAQLEILGENSRDAEKCIDDYKKVIAVMSETMKENENRAVSAGGLGAHADFLLRKVQAELDSRLDELEEQQRSIDAICANERRMAITVENLRRERDSALAARKLAEDHSTAAATEMEELHRKISVLERRLMLTAQATSRPSISHPNVSRQIRDFDESQSLANSPAKLLTQSPSQQSLDVAVAEIEYARQVHDNLVADIARQRDFFRNMLSAD